MKKTAILILIVLLQFSITPAHAAKVDLTEKLFFKNYIQFNFNNVSSRFLSAKRQLLINRYLSHKSISGKYTYPFKYSLSFIRSPNVLNAITYLNFKDNKKNLNELITLYYVEKRLALNEIVEDPRYDVAVRVPGKGNINIAKAVGGWLKTLGDTKTYMGHINKATACISRLKGTPIQRSGLIRNCLVNSFPRLRIIKAYGKLPYASIDLSEQVPSAPGVVISRTGFIKGNKVTSLNENRRSWDEKYLKKLESYHNDIVKKYKERWAGKTDQEMVEEMSEIIRTSKTPIYDVFSDGRPVDAFDVKKNIIWQSYKSSNPENQIFPKMLKAIKNAKSTIFFDIFFWGGTMAVSLTRELIKRSDLKIIFLHDNINHFGHKKEMAPVFNFLRAFMAVHPDRMLALPSFVFKNVSGLPSFLDGELGDSAWEKFGFDKKMSLYIEAKADHSKVLVIDGDKPDGNPVAFVGSKNMTDISGAICNDEVIMVEGPAAVVVLDNYWKDLYDALKENWRSDDFFAGIYNDVYEKGWAKNYGMAGNRFQKIKLMLAPIDILKRYSIDENDKEVKITKVMAETKGNALVRIGENSVGSFVVSSITQNIFSILQAKKQIIINDQFLYDVRIIRALIKKQREGVKVRVILEGFIHEGAPFPGMPNLLYLKMMKDAGIEVKWKLHNHSDIFVAEHHGKTLSVDGFSSKGSKVKDGNPSLIVGSANKDYMTMIGAFRETQVEVIDSGAQKTHDMLFWKNWNDSVRGSKVADTKDFENSDYGQKIKSQGFTVESFLSYVRGFVEMIYTLKSIER